MRRKRKLRVRSKIFGSIKRPRLSVFRSNRYLYTQAIDDGGRKTLVSLNDQGLLNEVKNRVERAQALGKKLAEELKKQKISTVIFDRSSFAYHGRVKALAEGLRAGGIKL